MDYGHAAGFGYFNPWHLDGTSSLQKRPSIPDQKNEKSIYSWISFKCSKKGSKIANNKYEYKKTKNVCKLMDMFQKNGQLAIAGTQICR